MKLIAPPTPTLLKRSAGVLRFVYSKGRWYVTGWPRPRGPAKSVYQQRAQDEMGWAGRATGRSTPQEWQASKIMITGTLYVPRDMLIRAMFGLVSEIVLEDGTLIMGVRVNVPEANLTLDQITVTPWALLVRTPQDFGWRGLLPGTPGQVLGVKGDGSVDYIDPSGAVESVFGRTGNVVATAGDYLAVQVSYDGSGSGLAATEVQGAIDELKNDLDAALADISPYLQAALDAMSASPGSIIYRGAADWLALSPGGAGQVLTAQGGSPELAWSTIGGGGGSQWYAPPLSTDFPTLRNTPVLTDVASSGLKITGAAGGTAIRAAYKALGGDKVYTARVWFQGQALNTSAGLAFRDSSGGKCITFGLDKESGGYSIQCTQWNNDTTATSNAWAAPGAAAPYGFLRATWHSVAKTIDLDFSYDGVNYTRMQTANAFIAAPNQVGLYVWSTTTGGFGAGVPFGLCDYWNEV